MTSLRVVGCCLLLASACGGDDDGDNGGGAVASSTQLQALTADQFNQVCAQYAAYSDQFEASEGAKKGACLGVASAEIVDNPPEGDLAMACQEAVNGCLGFLNPEAIKGLISELMGDICAGGPPATCTITVGDVDTCLDEGIDLLASVGTSSTCDSLAADGTLAGDKEGASPPASCVTIAETTCE